MGPDVDRLVGHLEAAENAVQRRALRVPVARDDAVLPEHLGAGGEGGIVKQFDSVCFFNVASSESV